MKAPAGSGHSPATVDTELVVSLKTTAPTTLKHCALAALLRMLFVPAATAGEFEFPISVMVHCVRHWKYNSVA